MNKSSHTPGDNLTLREQEALARHGHEGRLRYKDLDAGYCNACEAVYGVECPKCKMKSGPHFSVDSSVFRVVHPVQTSRADGLSWTMTECSKCSFMFQVIVH